MAAFMGFRWRGVFGGSVATNYGFGLTGGVNMNTIYYSLSGCAFIAALVQTALANSQLSLFQSSLSPDPETPLADYVTAEADFTGYNAGGETLATWNTPILSPTGGYLIQAPMTQWRVGSPLVTGNVIGGWFLTETGGDLIAAGTYGDPIPMQVVDQGIDLAPVLTFPTGV